MKGLINIIIILVLIPLGVNAQSEKLNIHFHQFPLQDLSNPNVKGIHQDETGFMWFFTQAGLNKYDGKRITIYHPFPQDSIRRRGYNTRALQEDENGMFWIATWNFGFTRFDPATGEFKIYKFLEGNYEEKGPKITIEAFLDSKNRIWLGSHLNGLHQFDPVEERIVKQYPFFPRDKDIDQAYSLEYRRPNKIWEDKDGMIWVLGKDTHLNRLDPKTEHIEKFNYPPFHPKPPTILKSY